MKARIGNRKKRKRIKDDDFSKGWPAWVRKGLRDFDKAEECAYAKWLLDDLPKWAIEMMKELWKSAAPSVPLELVNVSGPYFLGVFVGHTEMMLKSPNGFEQAMKGLDWQTKQLNRKICASLTKQDLAHLIKIQQKARVFIKEVRDRVIAWHEDISAIAIRKLKIIESIHAKSATRPFPEKSAFLDGYNRGLKQKVFNKDGSYYHAKSSYVRLQPITIYSMMVVHWRTVDTFKSFGELHGWLIKQFGKDDVGNLERLKRLCKRHGYNPGRLPGRPKKTSQKIVTEQNPKQVPVVVSNYILLSDVLQQAKRTIK